MKTKKMLVIGIIDDDVNLCESLKDYLELNGYSVIVSHTGKEGVEIIKQKKIDFLVLDLQLPDINGYEICQIIRKELKQKVLPIIIITGKFVSAEEKIQGLQLGADDFMAKPFPPEELLLRIKNLSFKIQNRTTHS
jgi:DNA-binding response OmpR family regulator